MNALLRSSCKKYQTFGGACCLEAKEDINFEWLNLLRQMAAMYEKYVAAARYFYRKAYIFLLPIATK